MSPHVQPGLAIKAKPTQINEACGIDAVTAKGYICKVDEGGISVYLQREHNRGWIEAVMHPEIFAWNFEEDRQRGDNIAYRNPNHFNQRYPDDYKV
ncbi:hypothetical protein [Hymenobacter sp. UYCo722]|uniref:hypothetical protein n=1 Tax=Hymenobacter sp. UYCo722 TaxID=3156335 RepID=UPI003392AB9A